MSLIRGLLEAGFKKLQDPIDRLEQAMLSLSVGKGKMWYVDSVNGDDTYDGKSWKKAKATIDAAVGLCTASVGDVILVAPNHAEAVTSAGLLDLDVAGITIIGLGRGDERGLITIGATGVAGCDVDVDAAEITVRNLRFAVAAANVTAMIDVNAVGFTLEDCEINMNVTSYEAVTGIALEGVNAADRCTIRNCEIFALVAADSDEGIVLDDVEDRVVIEGCRIYGDFANAPIWTDAICTNILVKDCILRNDQTGDMALEFTAAVTGDLVNNLYHVDTDAATVDPGSCFSYQCWGCDTINTSGFRLPAIGSAT